MGKVEPTMIGDQARPQPLLEDPIPPNQIISKAWPTELLEDWISRVKNHTLMHPKKSPHQRIQLQDLIWRRRSLFLGKHFLVLAMREEALASTRGRKCCSWRLAAAVR